MTIATLILLVVFQAEALAAPVLPAAWLEQAASLGARPSGEPVEAPAGAPAPRADDVARDPRPPVRELFGGEFLLAADGIYTRVHRYTHPDSGVEVLLLGMNHGGDKAYFERVRDILKSCDAVVHEGEGAQRKDDAKSEEALLRDARSRIDDADLDQAFQAATRAYFLGASAALRLQDEWEAFDYGAKGWVSADAEFFGRVQKDEAFRKRWQARIEKAPAVPDGRKREIVAYARKALDRMDRGQFTASDFGDGFHFLWSDPALLGYVQEAYGFPRDEVALEVFDKAVRERKPQRICIKFGAAHIANQRKLLEERGYRHAESASLRNIRY